jgi:hypothetical protein
MPKQFWKTKDFKEFDNEQDAIDHEAELDAREASAIRGVAATICQGRPRESLTDEQRQFINEVVAPEIYYQRSTIVMHLYPKRNYS